MSFVAPLMLIGVLGASIPILIHLFGRARARRVRFAAVDFLLGTDKRLAARMRLRERLVLAMRVLACLAIALALAKPFTSCDSALPAVERGAQAAVLIVDNSFASGYQGRDGALVSEGKRMAKKILKELGPEADVALVLAVEDSTAPSELSRDHLRLQSEIDDVRESAGRVDLGRAFRIADQLLRGTSHQRRSIFVLSPLAAMSEVPPLPPWPLEQAPGIHWMVLADGERLDNFAVTGVEVEADPSAGTRGIRVVATVVSYSQDSASKELRVLVNGAVKARAQMALAPGDVEKKTFSVTIPEDERTARITVELDSDRLPVDDRRFVVASLRDNVRVLLVNGDPRTVRHEDELFYLSAAMSPDTRTNTGVRAASITSTDLASVELDEYDVLFLANMIALPIEESRRIEAWTRRGGGVFISVGDQVDPEAYNQAMIGLLPQKLSAVVDATYGARGAESDTKAERLAKLEVAHPVFKIFGDAGKALRGGKFSKLLLLGPTSNVDGRRILARYENGAAALVEGRIGRGLVFLLTSTIDRDWNDLCIQPGFLPFIQQSVRYLARKELSTRNRNLWVGASAVVPVSEGDSELIVIGPGGQEHVFEADRLEGRETIRFGATASPGIYRVAASQTGTSRRDRPEAGFAVNTDPSLSAMARVVPPVATDSDGTGRPATANSRRRRVELWHGLGAALLLFLVIESALVVRR